MQLSLPRKGTGHIRLSLACLRSFASLCPNLAHSFGNLPFCSGRHFAFLSRCCHLRRSSLCALWVFRTHQLLSKLKQFLIDPFALDFETFDCKFQQPICAWHSDTPCKTFC